MTPQSRCAPSPRWGTVGGEGRGEGVWSLSRDRNPSPHPSPYGALREREPTEFTDRSLAPTGNATHAATIVGTRTAPTVLLRPRFRSARPIWHLWHPPISEPGSRACAFPDC